MKELLLVLLLLASFPAWSADEKESGLDRVLRTHTLRCAYTIYPTYVEKDPNTGKFSGLFYDLMEELGKELNIKIVWAEEVGSDQLFSGMGTRYDANCTGYFSTPGRAMGGDFTKPLVYSAYNVYVRANETRIKTFDDLNSDKLTAVVLDGELSQTIVAENMPKTKVLAQPALTPATDRLQAIVANKADFTTMEPGIAEAFMAANPGKLKQLTDKPYQYGGSVIVLAHNEFSLKNLLDTTIDNMLWTGALKRIAKAHEKFPNTILVPITPYERKP